MCIPSRPRLSLHPDPHKFPQGFVAPFAKIGATPPCEKRAIARPSRHVVVQHHYHDHSQDRVSIHFKIEDILALKCSSSAAFPLRLFDMLEHVGNQKEEEEKGLNNIVSWQPHGRCFVIHKPKEFADQVLPRFFSNMSKLTSFQRQLNLYGFGRITHQGPDKGAYYHEKFLQGRLDLVCQIQRIKVKGTGVRGKADPDSEPRFWKMPFMAQQQQQQQHPVELLTRGDSPPSGATQETMERTTFPLVSVSACSYPFSFQKQEQPDEDEDILIEWGMPFHALDMLPEDIESECKKSATTTPVTVVSSLREQQQRRRQKDQAVDNEFFAMLLDDNNRNNFKPSTRSQQEMSLADLLEQMIEI